MLLDVKKFEVPQKVPTRMARIEIEEEEIDIVATIPAHLKEFSELQIDSVTASELCVTIDGHRLKGKIGDTISTNLFFGLNEDTHEAELLASCDKTANLEHVFRVPKEEFAKPFIPTESAHLRQNVV
jgi:hypothetical protein